MPFGVSAIFLAKREGRSLMGTSDKKWSDEKTTAISVCVVLGMLFLFMGVWSISLVTWPHEFQEAVVRSMFLHRLSYTEAVKDIAQANILFGLIIPIVLATLWSAVAYAYFKKPTQRRR